MRGAGAERTQRRPLSTKAEKVSGRNFVAPRRGLESNRRVAALGRSPEEATELAPAKAVA